MNELETALQELDATEDARLVAMKQHAHGLLSDFDLLIKTGE